MKHPSAERSSSTTTSLPTSIGNLHSLAVRARASHPKCWWFESHNNRTFFISYKPRRTKVCCSQVPHLLLFYLLRINYWCNTAYSCFTKLLLTCQIHLKRVLNNVGRTTSRKICDEVWYITLKENVYVNCIVFYIHYLLYRVFIQ